MLKCSSNKISRNLAPVLLALVLPLAGCAATDQWAQDDLPLTPYGGSKLHPIKVVGNKATVDDCGQWDVDGTDTDHNLFTPNHGCAVQANIAAMAARPRDLVRARPMAKAPAEPRVKAVVALGGLAASTAPSSASAGGTTP
jgi:type IV pilus biogenesis protein CpaD/CtpE